MNVQVQSHRFYVNDRMIRYSFYNIENVLPITKTTMQFAVHPRHGVQKIVDQGTSAEIVLDVKEIVDDLKTEILNDVCTTNDTQISGCSRG